MRSDLDPQARQLADYMSELSEQAYAAGWMAGLEYELWAALISGPRDYGRLHITNEHIMRLRKLSHDAGGWIVFDDDHEETRLPIADWDNRFVAWNQKRGT